MLTANTHSPVYYILGGRLLAPRWLYLWLLWNHATEAHQLLVSSVIQDLDSTDVGWCSMVGNAATSVLLAPFVHVLQAMALISCLVVPAVGFDVIAKS